MADILDYNFRTTGRQRQMPEILISFRIVRSDDQNIELDDKSEANGKQVLFPNFMADLEPEDRQDLVNHIAEWVLDYARKKAEGE